MVEFRPTRSAQRGAIPIPKANPARDIARGVSQVAGAVAGAAMDDRQLDERQRETDHAAEMAELNRRRQAEIADSAGRFAVLQAEMQTEAEQARIAPDAKPGATGHADAMRIKFDQRLSEFRATLSQDEEVQARFGPMIAKTGADLYRRERAFEMSETAKHQGNQWQTYSDAKLIQLQRNPTLENLQSALDESTGLIEGMGFTGTERAQIANLTHRGMATTVLEAQIAGGVEGAERARQILDEGHLDHFLDADTRDSLYGSIDRTKEMERIRQERAEVEATRTAQEQVRTVRAMLDAGAEPTPAEMAAVKQNISLLPPHEQVEFAALEVQLTVNQDTRGKSSIAIRNNRDDLQRKVDAGKATQTEQIYLQAYNQRLEAAIEAEKDETGDLLSQGIPGRTQAIEMWQKYPSDLRFEKAERQERGLGHIAILPAASSRAQAIRGREIRKAKQIFEKDTVEADFRGYVGSLSAILEDQYDDKLSVALDLYAAHLNDKPDLKYDVRTFRQYINVAMGAIKRQDGVWQGGISTVNQRRVLLPDRLSGQEFANSIAKTDWSQARDAKGQPVQKSWIVDHMFPVLVEETPTKSYYHMKDFRGNILLAPNGKPLRWGVENGVRR